MGSGCRGERGGAIDEEGADTRMGSARDEAGCMGVGVDAGAHVP
jgi:hypothetical protein